MANPNVFGSYNESSLAQPRTLHVPHSKSTIRMNTVELSKMSFSPPSEASSHIPSFIFPPAVASSVASSSSASVVNEDLSQSRTTISSDGPSFSSSRISIAPSSSPSSSSSSFTTQKATSPPPMAPSPPQSSTTGDTTPRIPFRPSGLSLLRQEYGFAHGPDFDESQTPTPTAATPHSEFPPLPKVHWTDRPRPPRASGSTTSMSTTVTATPGPNHSSPLPAPATPTEATPLLYNGLTPHPTHHHHPHTYSPPHYNRISGPVSPSRPPFGLLSPPPPSPPSQGLYCDSDEWLYRKFYSYFSDHAREKARNVIVHAASTSVRNIPAVLLGSLLNILDGVSCERVVLL